MKTRFLQWAAVALAVCAAAMAAPAVAQDWVYSAQADQGPRLVFDDPGGGPHPVHFDFRCAGGQIVAAQAGAVELMDLSTGKTVPDTGLAELPKGAAVMALLTEKTPEVTATSKPGFVPAQAQPDAVRGWDLFITVPMDDVAVKALDHAKAVSLMSTGFTTMVPLGRDGRAAMSTFLKACKGR